jgi:hypothetical protein
MIAFPAGGGGDARGGSAVPRREEGARSADDAADPGAAPRLRRSRGYRLGPARAVRCCGRRELVHKVYAQRVQRQLALPGSGRDRAASAYREIAIHSQRDSGLQERGETRRIALSQPVPARVYRSTRAQI